MIYRLPEPFHGGIFSIKDIKHAQIFRLDTQPEQWTLKIDDRELKFSTKEAALAELEKIIKLKGALPMVKTIGTDVKQFIAEHKSVIYWIAILFLADHFLFQGAFRERLHEIMNKLLGKVEAEIEKPAPPAIL